jgi:hypothetical protein
LVASAARSSPNTHAVIGGAIGVVTFLALVSGLFLLRRRSRRKFKQEREQERVVRWSENSPEPNTSNPTGHPQPSLLDRSVGFLPHSASVEDVGGTTSSLRSLIGPISRRYSRESSLPAAADNGTPNGEHPPLVPITSEEPIAAMTETVSRPRTAGPIPRTHDPHPAAPSDQIIIEQQLVAIRDQVERELAELRAPVTDADRETHGDIPPRYRSSWLNYG